MPRVTPKTNWTSDPDNAPLPSDFNRIEGNSQQAFDEIDEKQANIDAEEARAIADVDAEEARAIAAEDAINADLGGLDFVNGNAGTYGQKNIAQNEVWVIPKGAYLFTAAQSAGTTVIFRVKYSDGVNFIGFNGPFMGGFILSDGVNYNFTGLNDVGGAVIFYRKIS